MERVPAIDPAARIDRLLREEPVVWLSTVREDGRPHLVPVWFSWDGERLVVASKPDAVKVRNVRANPQVMVALGEAEDDFDVGLVEAEADLPAMPSADLIDDAHFEKYAHQLAEIGLTRDEYLATYAQPIVIRPTRFLPWHGRTVPASAAPANAAPQAALPERLPGWLRGGQLGWLRGGQSGWLQGGQFGWLRAVPRTWLRGGPRTWLRAVPRTWLSRPMRRAFA